MSDDASLDELGRQLLEEPSWKGRARAAQRLGEIFCAGGLSPEEHGLLEEFFRLSSFDEEVLVRRMLAESLKRASTLSRPTLLAFACDRAEVAAPLIEHSPLLEEEDLLRILEGSSPAHRLALARRFRVSAPIAGLLLAAGDELLTATLLRNRGAAIAEDRLYRLISPPVRPRVVGALLQRRPLLPPRVLAATIDFCGAFAFAGPTPPWRVPGEAAWQDLVPAGARRAERRHRGRPRRI